MQYSLPLQKSEFLFIRLQDELATMEKLLV